MSLSPRLSPSLINLPGHIPGNFTEVRIIN
jgi:hypothetical protein